jgi:UDP-N-acetylmuramoylalanine--D-glutamate ligase
LDNGRFSPDYSVITNITPNHLDWHRDMDEYESAKKIIYRYQGQNKRTVLSYDCEATGMLKGRTGVREFFFSKNRLPESFEDAVYCSDGGITVRTAGGEQKIIDRSDIFIKGEHNVQNFMAAIGVTHDIAGTEAIKKVAQNFKGVEHRIEFVREVGGVSYYNSSIDSSPTRTIAALNHFDETDGNIVVILGGYDKQIAFEPLVPVVSKKAKAAVLYGDTKEKIRKTFENNPADTGLKLISADDFDSAVEQASSLAQSGDIVLLSPACASFDCFKNFEVRGNRFKEIVKKL